MITKFDSSYYGTADMESLGYAGTPINERRYSKEQLRRLIESSPLKLERLGYFNSLLFPLAVAERTASKWRGKDNGDVKLPPRPLNALLEKVFAAERHLVGRLPLPPGLSLFAVASAI